MGNICDSRQVPKELPEEKEVKFFLQLGVRWVEVATAQLHEKAQLAFSLREASKLNWKDYFSTFKSINDAVSKSNAELERKYWHPACGKYLMTHEAAPLEQQQPRTSRPEKGLDDDFTNDEASEDSISTRDSQDIAAIPSSSRKPMRRYPAGCNPETTSPIFFGYSSELESAHKEKLQGIEAAAKERERRALTKAMKARSAVVDAMEKRTQQQEAFRVKKIDDLSANYLKEKKKRDDEHNEGVGQLAGDVLRLVRVGHIIPLLPLPQLTAL